MVIVSRGEKKEEKLYLKKKLSILRAEIIVSAVSCTVTNSCCLLSLLSLMPKIYEEIVARIHFSKTCRGLNWIRDLPTVNLSLKCRKWLLSAVFQITC